jgi:A/G-specific adenine glycosylase
VFDSEAALLEALPPPWRQQLRELEAVSHSLTHRELRLHPRLLTLDAPLTWPAAVPGDWVDAAALHGYGLPAPVQALLAPWLDPSPP